MLASMQGHADCVQYLLAQDAEANVQDRAGNTPLHLAANRRAAASELSPKGMVETVAALLRSDIFLDMQNGAGYTALMVAVGNGHSSVVSALLEAGATCRHTAKDGEDALSLAHKLNREVIATILQRRCDSSPAGEL